MERSINDEIASAEQEWLAGWKRGPTRVRWTKLPLQAGDAAPDTELIDMTGNAVRLSSYWEGKPAVLIFLRHFGCSCAFDRAARLRSEYVAYTEAGANVVAIGQGEPGRAKVFATQRELPCPLLGDPDRHAYVAFDLLEGKPSQVVYDAPEEYQRREFAAGAKLQQARHGSERAAVDSPWQLPGDFVVDRHGVLRLTYRAQFCDDYVDPQVLVAAIREAVLDL